MAVAKKRGEQTSPRHKAGKRILASITFVYIFLLYVPFIIMFILSFTGPTGGPTFPMQGVSLFWYQRLFGVTLDASVTSSAATGAQMAAIGAPLTRSLILALLTAVISTLLGLMTAMALRRRFRGANFVFYFVLLGVIVPGIVYGLGITLLFQMAHLTLHWYTTGLAVHVVWTYPFCLIVFMMMFNRFDLSLEEASRVLGANEWVTFRRVTLPLIMPGVMTSALFGFTLSFDEYIRSFFATGSTQSLPLVILSSLTARITPTIYALGTLTTLVSLSLIAAFVIYLGTRQRRNRGPAGVAPAEPAKTSSTPEPAKISSTSAVLESKESHIG